MYPHLSVEERQGYLMLFRQIDAAIEAHIFAGHGGSQKPCAYCVSLESIAEAANARATGEPLLRIGLLSLTPVCQWKR